RGAEADRQVRRRSRRRGRAQGKGNPDDVSVHSPQALVEHRVSHGARHVAIIMDGNGRWAKQRHLPRAVGRQKGGEAVRRTVKACAGLGIECLTLYAFSSENWKRGEEEVGDLMNLMRRFIRADLEDFVEQGIRLKIIGDYKVMEPDIVTMLEDALERTRQGTRTLAVALNYGAQQEIARAATKAAGQGAITPDSIAAYLDTA